MGEAVEERKPVVVPKAWVERGFSGRYWRVVRVADDAAATFGAMRAPYLLESDRAWLVLEIGRPNEAEDGAVTRPMVQVRLDASAALDLSARTPSPGAYREPT